MRGFPSFFSIGAVAVLAGCSVYDSSLLGRALGLGQGGSGGGSGGSQNQGPRCEDAAVVSYPSRPDVSQTDAQAKRDIGGISVQYQIDLGDQEPIPVGGVGVENRFGTVGLNIDGICTNQNNYRSPSGAECELPPFAAGLIDGPGGIDNAIGADVQKVRDSIMTFTSANYTNFLRQGGANFIYRLSQWNGEANDPQVRVDIYVAAAFDSIDNPHGAVPKWDGTDVWPIASDSVMNNDRDQPRYFDANAYVANYKVVASLGTAVLRLETGLSGIGPVNLNMPLHGSVIVCDLEQTDSGPWGWNSSNCVLGGRWIANDLLHELGQFPDPTAGSGARVPLCTHNAPYHLFKSQICSLIDTFSGERNPTAVCDSLSIGVGWVSRPAVLGDVYELPPLEDPCLPDVDPANDCCENFEDAGMGVCNNGQSGSGGSSSSGGSAANGGSGGASGSGGSATGGTSGSGGKSSGSGGKSSGSGGRDASVAAGGMRDASALD